MMRTVLKVVLIFVRNTFLENLFLFFMHHTVCCFSCTICTFDTQCFFQLRFLALRHLSFAHPCAGCHLWKCLLVFDRVTSQVGDVVVVVLGGWGESSVLTLLTSYACSSAAVSMHTRLLVCCIVHFYTPRRARCSVLCSSQTRELWYRWTESCHIYRCSTSMSHLYVCHIHVTSIGVPHLCHIYRFATSMSNL